MPYFVRARLSKNKLGHRKKLLLEGPYIVFQYCNNVSRVRNACVGLSSMVGRVGAILSPYVARSDIVHSLTQTGLDPVHIYIPFLKWPLISLPHEAKNYLKISLIMDFFQRIVAALSFGIKFLEQVLF